jgi:hypothetical protein
MTKPKYDSLLIKLRLTADQAGDQRSLVAIVAQFERDAPKLLRTLAQSINKKAHTRNELSEG